jgi:hypothetical protein
VHPVRRTTIREIADGVGTMPLLESDGSKGSFWREAAVRQKRQNYFSVHCHSAATAQAEVSGTVAPTGNFRFCRLQQAQRNHSKATKIICAVDPYILCTPGFSSTQAHQQTTLRNSDVATGGVDGIPITREQE